MKKTQKPGIVKSKSNLSAVFVDGFLSLILLFALFTSDLSSSGFSLEPPVQVLLLTLIAFFLASMLFLRLIKCRVFGIPVETMESVSTSDIRSSMAFCCIDSWKVFPFGWCENFAPNWIGGLVNSKDPFVCARTMSLNLSEGNRIVTCTTAIRTSGVVWWSSKTLRCFKTHTQNFKVQ